MSNSVLILGGYGNFGKRISRSLAKKGVPIFIAGRDGAKVMALAKEIGGDACALKVDVTSGLQDALIAHRLIPPQTWPAFIQALRFVQPIPL